MAKINLKEIDFKQFFIQKGERIALWAMVGVMAVLIVFGVFINGFSRGSASGNSGEINDLCTRAKSALSTSAPAPGSEKPDDIYTGAARLAEIDRNGVDCKHALFSTQDREDKKWRKPEVLSPDEFQVTMIRGLFRSYIPTTVDGKQGIMFLVPKGKDGVKPPAGPNGPAMAGRGRMPQINGMARIWGQPGAAGPGMMMPPGMRGAMPGMAPQVAAEDEGQYKMIKVPVDQVAAESGKDGGRPAEAVYPVRIGIVNATFPYRRQFEVFQHALGKKKSIEEMEQEASVEFLGVNVQRREIGPDGQPLGKGEWRDLDLITPLRPFLAFGRESEDPTLKAYGIVWPGDRLLVPRPFLGRNQTYPAAELPSLDKTIKDIEDAIKAGQPPPPPVRAGNKFGKDYDFFGDDEAIDPKKGPMGVAMGEGVRKPMPMPVVREGAPSANGFGSQERLLPEKCLVRFIDIQIEPGHTYEYRVQVKMGNPLHGKKDEAISKKLTENKEMVGEWTMVPKKLHVPVEGDFYIYEDAAHARKFGYNPDRIWTQIHRWFDWVPVNPAAPRESLTAIGDWGLAEQSAAMRGEYIGRWEEVELPIWNSKLEEFVLAQHPDTYKKRPGGVRLVQHKGVPVDFNTGALLVDFDGGRAEVFYKDKDRKENKVRDESAVEALVLTAEGKLVVRDSRADTDSKERVDRVKESAEWIKAVREKVNNKPGGNTGDPFFGDKKPKGP